MYGQRNTKDGNRYFKSINNQVTPVLRHPFWMTEVQIDNYTIKTGWVIVFSSRYAFFVKQPPTPPLTPFSTNTYCSAAKSKSQGSSQATNEMRHVADRIVNHAQFIRSFRVPVLDIIRALAYQRHKQKRIINVYLQTVQTSCMI